MSWFEAVPFDEWRAHLLESSASPWEDARDLFCAWVREELDRDHRGPDEDGAAFDRRVGRFFAELPERFESDAWIERPAATEREVRRWCWAPAWTLLSQDEDLMVMGPRYDRWLLEEAAAGCPKRGYVVGIVTHSLRDDLHGALWPRPGAPDAEVGGAAVRKAVDAALARAAGLLERVEATGEAAAAGYVRRLASYRGEGSVDRDAAARRVLDVRRCYPAPHDAPRVERRGELWIAPISRAGTSAAELVIRAADGRMWGRPAG